MKATHLCLASILDGSDSYFAGVNVQTTDDVLDRGEDVLLEVLIVHVVRCVDDKRDVSALATRDRNCHKSDISVRR